MIEFVCAGLDIRTTFTDQRISADATVWEQDEKLYERAKSELSIKENTLQLLHPIGNREMSRLVELVKTKPGAALVSLELPRVVFDACPQAKGLLSPVNLSGYMWDSLGFDICDINGFFSFLDMTGVAGSPIALFEEKRLIDAFVLAQAANFTIPEHSPFVVIQLRLAKFY
jgi:hypothetical protein